MKSDDEPVTFGDLRKAVALTVRLQLAATGYYDAWYARDEEGFEKAGKVVDAAAADLEREFRIGEAGVIDGLA